MSNILKYLIEKSLKKNSIKNKTFDDIVKKNLRKGSDVESIKEKVKSSIVKGTKVEMEHTNNKEVAKKIAMDHLFEDLEYYEKLKKIESKEATSSGSSGSFAPPLTTTKEKLDEIMRVGEHERAEDVLKMVKEFDRDLHRQILYKMMDAYAESFEGISDLVSRSEKVPDEVKEKIKKMSQDIISAEQSSKKKKKVKKTETKEATGSGSSGSYATPAAWAKSTKKGDWRGRKKTQIPGGKFVTIKKRCKTFPYCNQGDIKALKIYENDRVMKIINEISNNYNIPTNVIKSIIQNEIETKGNKSV